ncbi:MAG: CvpA family protein [Bacilli bacterium]|nr:CvpA family protein [Bacilli bacterium]
MLDIIIILFILFGGLVGFKRGIIKQSVITIGMIFVIVLSFILKNPVSALMYKHLPFFTFGGLLENVAVLNILLYEVIAFFLVFSILSAILLILVKISSIMEKILKATIILAIPSKILGAIFGMIEYYLVVFIVMFILMQPTFKLNNTDLFKYSKLKNVILEKTPFMSAVVENSLSTFNEINDLTKNKDDSDDKEFNCECINIMVKNKIIEEDSIEYLYSKNKIKTKCEIGE